MNNTHLLPIKVLGREPDMPGGQTKRITLWDATGLNKQREFDLGAADEILPVVIYEDRVFVQRSARHFLEVPCAVIQGVGEQWLYTAILPQTLPAAVAA